MPLTAEEQARKSQLEQELGVSTTPNLSEVREDLLGPEAKAKRSELNKGAVEAMAASFVPEGTANPLSWLASKTGLDKIPGKLMSSAVGLKKYIPGVGESLMDQGVYGTKGAMQNQVAAKLGEQEAAKQALLKDLPGTVDSMDVAEDVRKLGKRYATESGIIPREVKPEYLKVRNAAVDIANRGEVSATDAGKLASIAGNLGYRGDKPVQQLAGVIGQKEHAGYRQGLEKLYEEANPGQPNEVQNTYHRLSSLIRAKKGLGAPETSAIDAAKGVGLGSIIGGLTGAAAGGIPGAGVGAALGSAVLGTPLGKASAAYATRAGGKVAARAPLDAAALAADQSSKAPSGLTPEEKARKDQLEQELGIAAQ